jgi:hypothetical protein
MCTTNLILAVLTFVPTLAVCRTPQPQPPEVLTPDQIAYQAALKTYNAQADAIRARAKAAYASETIREKAPECPDAKSTLDENICLSHEDGLTAANYCQARIQREQDSRW